MLIEAVDPDFKEFSYQTLSNPELLTIAGTQFPLIGTLEKSFLNAYYYLKIDDNFILKLFPMLQSQRSTTEIFMPDYFEPDNYTGAHISLIYPNEIHPKLTIKEVGEDFHFIIKNLMSVTMYQKCYYILVVESPVLLQLRKNYLLSEKLNFHGLLVPFHITIGIQYIL